MLYKNIVIVIFVSSLCLILSCCNPENDDPNNGNHVNGDNGNIDEPEELTWSNPWLTSPINSAAVYITEQGEESWELVAGMPSPVVKITIPGDEDLGIEDEIKQINIKFQEENSWWKTKREEGMDFTYPVKLADNTEILCAKIVIGNQILLVSEQVPFDGIVEKLVDNKSVLKLLSFTKSADKSEKTSK